MSPKDEKDITRQTYDQNASSISDRFWDATWPISGKHSTP